MDTIDWKYVKAIWANLGNFHKKCSERYPKKDAPQLMLEIGASEVHKNASDYFPDNVKFETLDITEITKPDILGDITKKNESIEDGRYDFISICEVLEHTKEFWNAPAEINRILKSGGYVFCTVPCNLGMHPPFPDRWRFTADGLKELFKQFKIIDLDHLMDKNRPNFPIQYTLVAQKI